MLPRTSVWQTFGAMKRCCRTISICYGLATFSASQIHFCGRFCVLKRVLHTGPLQNLKKHTYSVFCVKMCQFEGPGPGGNNSLFRSFSVPALTLDFPGPKMVPGYPSRSPNTPQHMNFFILFIDSRPIFGRFGVILGFVSGYSDKNKGSRRTQHKQYTKHNPGGHKTQNTTQTIQKDATQA